MSTISTSTISTLYPGDDVMAGLAAVTAILLLTSISLGVALLLPRRPTTRHTLLLSALICSLATPLLAVALRGWEFSTLIWHVAPAQRPAAIPLAAPPPEFTIATAPAASTRDDFPRRDRARRAMAPRHGSMPILEPPAASMPVMPPPPIDAAILAGDEPPIAVRDYDPSRWQPASPPLVAAAPVLNAPPSQPAQAARPPALARQVPVALRGWLVLVVSVWSAISAVLLVRVAVSAIWLLRLRRFCHSASGDVPEAVLAEVRRASGGRELPPILCSQRAQSPFAAGLFRPLVILPAGLPDKLSTDELVDVLTHECAHALRCDPAVRYLQAIAGGLFWPLPTIHLVNRQLAQAREEICDNYVLGQREPVAYAETLLKVAALVGRGEPTLAAVGILPRRGKLEARIAGLIAQRRGRATQASRLGAAFCLATLLLASAIACGTTVREDEAEKPAAPAASAPASDPPRRATANPPTEAPPGAVQPAAEDKPSAEETAAADVFKRLIGMYEKGRSEGPESQYVWSRRWMDAQTARNPSPAGRLEAVQAHAERMKDLKTIAEKFVAAGQGTGAQVSMANYYVAEAERLVETTKVAFASLKSMVAPPPMLREQKVDGGVLMERYRGRQPGTTTPWRPVQPSAGPQAPVAEPAVADDGPPSASPSVSAEAESVEPDGAGPDSAESGKLKIPTPDELLAIEQQVIAERQKLHSGRVALATYFPVPDKDGGQFLQFVERFILFFDGAKKRCDEIDYAKVLHKISTPTSFVSWPVALGPLLVSGDNREILFDPKTPTPYAGEVADARLLGLVLEPVADLGQHTLDSVFSHQDRTNLKIEAGSDEAAGRVLKVHYDYASKQGHPISMEYWLAPRLGYLPVYCSLSRKVEGVTNRSTLRSKYARYQKRTATAAEWQAAHQVDIWFPSEVDFRHEPASLGLSDRVARVERAEFNLVLPPLTFDRRGVEQDERNASSGAKPQAGAASGGLPQAATTAPRAGQSPYAPSPPVASPPPLGAPVDPSDGPTPCVATADPPPAGAVPPPIPTAEELQKIEQRLLENRRHIRSGRLEADQFILPDDDPRILQVAGHDLYVFNGQNVTEEHGVGWKKKSYLVRTSKRLARMDVNGEVFERVFEGDKQAPPADANSRFMGFDTGGLSLVEWLAKPDRRDQRILAGVKDGEPVLKVRFSVGDEPGQEVEYWLAPRCDYLPIYTSRTQHVGNVGTIRDSAVVKLARYQPVGVWFPTEIISRRDQLDDGKWKLGPLRVLQRVKQAWFTIGPEAAESEDDEDEAEGYALSPPTAPPSTVPPSTALPPTAPPKLAPPTYAGAPAPAVLPSAPPQSVPTPDELLAIEKKFLDERRALPSGSVGGILYKPADDNTPDDRLSPASLRSLYPDDLERIGRYDLAFDRRKKRSDWRADGKMLTLISTPTSFVRWGEGKSIEEHFARQNPAPRSEEVPDPLALGLAPEPIDALGRSPLDACFAHRERQNLKIERALDAGEPVLKVSYSFADGSVSGGPVEMEYWLSPRNDNFPVYLAERWKTAEGIKGKSIHVGLFGWGGSTYPLLIKRYTLEGGEWRMIDLLHVDTAGFRQDNDPSWFTRQGGLSGDGPVPYFPGPSARPVPDSDFVPVPTAPPVLPDAKAPPAEAPPAAEPKASGAAQPTSKATQAVGLLDPEGVSRLRVR